MLNAIRAAQAVAAALRSGFGPDTLRGLSAETSELATTSIADRIESSAASAEAAGEAMAAASGVLGGVTAAQAPALREMLAGVRDNPESAPTVRSHVKSLMSTAYSSPMVALVATMPEPQLDPRSDRVIDLGSGSGPDGGGNGPDGGGRRPSGATTELDTGAPPTGPGGPGPTGPAGGKRPAKQPGPSPAPTPSGQPGGAPNSPRGRGDDPTTLPRGGRGTPAGTRPSSPGTPGSPSPARTPSPLGSVPPGSVPGGAVAGESLYGTSDFPLRLFASGTPTGAGGAGASPLSAPPAGRAPMGPMAPPGSRPRDSDTRHRPAPYLHHGENGREIVGELPLVGPPVNGDWALRASVPGPAEPAVQPVDFPVEARGPEGMSTTGAQPDAGGVASAAVEATSDTREPRDV